MNLPRLWSYAAIGAVVFLGGMLLIREGVHREQTKADAALLKSSEKSLDATRAALRAARSKVDTVRVTVAGARGRVDTIVREIDSAVRDRREDARTVGRLRTRADSLLLAVSPAVLIARDAVVKAAYAYREEADSLRAQKRRVDVVLDSVRADLLDVSGNLQRSQLTLEALSGSLLERDDELTRLKVDMGSLRAARECRVLGLVKCPSRTVTFVAGAVLGGVAMSRR